MAGSSREQRAYLQKSDPNRTAYLLKTARLFYLNQLSKTQISKQVGVSVTQVVRFLEEARNEGIVRFEFHPPRRARLEAGLRAKFTCLREVIVISTETDYVVQAKSLAMAAARYFDEKVGAGAKIGLSGGLTIFEMVKYLPEKFRSLQLYPTAILGRGDRILNHIDPIVSLTLLWAKNGFQKDGVFFATVLPAERKNRALTREEIRGQMIEHPLANSAVRRIYSRMNDLDFVFASMREIEEPAKDIDRSGANAADLLRELGNIPDVLKKEGVVGDFNYSFIDQAGETRPEWRFFLSLEAGSLKKMAAKSDRSIVAIAGANKQKVLCAALKGKLLNVLITDERTAEVLL